MAFHPTKDFSATTQAKRMRLDFYFAWRFLKTFLGLFAIFACIYMLLDMVDQIRRFDSGTVGFLGILRLTALNVPSGLYKILPLIVILSTLVLFLGLARSSELVVVRAAGRSGMRALVSPVLVALILGTLTVAIYNPMVAATTKQYEIESNKLKHGARSISSINNDELWLRQGNEEGQTVIRAERSNLDGTQLFAVTFLRFGLDGLPTYRIEADTAVLTPGAWIATNAKQWRFSGSDNPEHDAVRNDQVLIATDLTQNQIRNSFGTPSSIPVWELPAFIKRLERAGFSARQHRVWFQMQLALPAVFAAMVMIGAGFTMRPTRLGHTGIMVLSAILLGFAIFFIRNFAQILGENGQIPILMAAWAPPVAAILMTLGLLLHLEDG